MRRVPVTIRVARPLVADQFDMESQIAFVLMDADAIGRGEGVDHADGRESRIAWNADTGKILNTSFTDEERAAYERGDPAEDVYESSLGWPREEDKPPYGPPFEQEFTVTVVVADDHWHDDPVAMTVLEKMVAADEMIEGDGVVLSGDRFVQIGEFLEDGTTQLLVNGMPIPNDYGPDDGTRAGVDGSHRQSAVNKKR